MTTSLPDLVTTQWLAAQPDAADITVIDASHHLPAAARDAASEFAAAHIPGARFLDLASLTDPTSSVPAALPRPDQLAARLALLGAAPGSRIVVYDDSAIRTSARAWFMLTISGWNNVAILDGGMAKWRSEMRPVEAGTPTVVAATPATFVQAQRVRTKADMLANITTRAAQVVDARGADRVFGSGIDPVHGGPNGRIPGALNLPFTQVLNADGTFKSVADLRAAFTAAGIDLTQPIIGTCGSGITASVLLFALHLIGVDSAELYDGSWSEWSADLDLPKLEGPDGAGLRA